MKTKWNALAFTLVMCLGGIIGFRASPNQNLQASEITCVRWVDIPKTDVSLPNAINIDLQEEKVSFSGNTNNTTVVVKKETVEVPKYVVKEVVKPEYERNFQWENKLLNKVAPLHLQKINVDRNQSSKTVYKGYKLQTSLLEPN